MATIEEDYTSFEIAKLLKEKGFDEPCYGSYSYRGGNVVVRASKLSNTDLCYHLDISGISAPTLQMTMKWLREVYKIFIEISVSIDLNGNYHYSYSILDKECKYLRNGYTDFDWNYEQACEVAIKYCLENLI